MQKNPAISLLPEDFNKSVFTVYMVILGVLSIIGLSVLLWKGKFLLLGLTAAIPLAVVIVIRPKLAVSQYIAMLFVSRIVVESIPLTVTDISGMLLIAAAILDFLLNNDFKLKLPRLSVNFIVLILALSVCALFAFEKDLALRAVLRVVLLFTVFLSMYRLLKSVGVIYALKFFYWLCVANSVVIFSIFASYGGRMRVFGLAANFFDDLAMLTLPLGLALYLWSEKGKSFKYLLGSVFVFAALVATQSRAPIMISVAVCGLLFLISLIRSRKEKLNEISELKSNSVAPKIILIVSVVSLIVIAAFALIPDLFEDVIVRFEDILSMDISGTLWKRIVLWENAFEAFKENPIVGIGPGNYKVLDFIYPTIKLNFVQFFVRGLNAHNLVLHYMAESGILGTIPMLLLMFNQFRFGRRSWVAAESIGMIHISSALYVVSITILLTTFIEADWMWGFAGYTFAFFVALIVHNYEYSASLKSD